MGADTAIPDSDWPDYEVPADVPRAEVTPAPAADTTTPPAPPASSSGTPPATPAPAQATGTPATTPPAGAPSAASPEPSTAPNELQQIQAGLREMAEFNRSLVEQNRVLTERLSQLTAQPPTPAAPPAPVEPPDPQTLAIRDRMFQVFPWLKDLEELAGKKTALLGAAEAVPAITADRTAAQEADRQYWENYRNQSFQTVVSSIAAEVLGQGKTFKDVDPAVASGIAEAFRVWVINDPKRAARYEGQDPALLGEFVDHYKAVTIMPLRRTENVAALDAAAAAPAIPRGGPSVQPGPAAQPSAPPAANNDEDEIHSRSWASFSQRAAS